MSGRAIFALLEQSPAPVYAVEEELSAAGEPAFPDSWPEPGTPLFEPLYRAAALVFLKPGGTEPLKGRLRALPGPRLYSHLAMFLAYVRFAHAWAGAHPEVSAESDPRARDHLGPLLAEEPRLAEFFRGGVPPCRLRDGRSVAQQAVAYALAESRAIGEAMPRILEGVSNAIGFQFAAAWALDPRAGVMRCVDFFRAPDFRAPAFETANRTKDEFLAIVSHELRTPLTAILGWVSLFRSGRLDEPNRAKALEVIERNSRAQAQMIEDLLDLSRVHSGKLHIEAAHLALAPAVQAAVDALRPLAETKGVSLEASIEAAVGPVSGDEGRLRQVVSNLISNAVKFTPKGGRVEVRAENVPAAAFRDEGSGPGTKVARIRVSDTGRGIRPDFLPHIFDPFRQADLSATRSHGGLGLGLTIVQHLVDLHGGTVCAESPGEGLGATFTIDLPLASGPEGAGAPGPAAEALGAVERSKPDVLLADIAMPGEDGLSLMRKVRGLGPAMGGQVPAIAVTVLSREDDRKRALGAGFDAHVAKPIEPARLVRAIGSLVGRCRAPPATVSSVPPPPPASA